jgi:opacity protein-like surface antigen
MADPWTGFSVSVGGGAAKTDTDLNVDTAFHSASGAVGQIPTVTDSLGHTDARNDQWNGFGTLQAGYDYRMGQFVLGTFADFDFYPGQPAAASSASFDGIQTQPGGFTHIFPDLWSVSSNVELENTWAVGGRAGYLATPDILLYADGGYTQAKLNGQVNFTYPDFVRGGMDQHLTLSVPDRMDGFFVGGGGEMKVADHIALRLEYRYAKYGGETRAATATSTSITPGLTLTQSTEVRARLDEQIQSVRAAVVLQLGEP